MPKIDLYQGDCLTVMDDLIKQGVKVDAVITDPPYGTTACKWDNVIPFEPMWNCLHKLTNDNSAICLFGSEPFSSYLRISNSSMYRYDLYWYKTLCSNFVMGKVQPFFKVENISIFYKNKPTYNPIMKKGSPYTIKESNILQKGMQHKYCFDKKSDIINEGERYPDNVLKFNSLGGNKSHPTQKPIDLMEYLIKTYSNENDTILDFTMGSGTTGVACKRLNRNFIGIELDENYFKIAKERIENTVVPKRLF